MGTTLALNGGHTLAGTLTQHPNDHTAAFAEYEKKMRPVVNCAQKLVPDAPHIMNPETAWGVWLLNTIMSMLCQSGLIEILVKFVGPPANTVPVEEYGFKQLQEMDSVRK